MLENFFPILIFIGIGAGLAIAMPIAAYIISSRRAYEAKDAPYECGFPEFGDARLPFDVRFYLVAILFIIFDLETAFLVPWAAVFRDLSGLSLFAMALFLGLLLVGFIYEWKKGALEWE